MAEGNNQMVNSSMVLNTSQVRAENGWNVDFEGVEDFDLSIRLARRGCRFFNVPEVLVYHRIHAASNFNAPGNHGQLIGLMKRHGIGS
jgi:GT2 family glycosyltransferase